MKETLKIADGMVSVFGITFQAGEIAKVLRRDQRYVYWFNRPTPSLIHTGIVDIALWSDKTSFWFVAIGCRSLVESQKVNVMELSSFV